MTPDALAAVPVVVAPVTPMAMMVGTIMDLRGFAGRCIAHAAKAAARDAGIRAAGGCRGECGEGSRCDQALFHVLLL